MTFISSKVIKHIKTESELIIKFIRILRCIELPEPKIKRSFYEVLLHGIIKKYYSLSKTQNESIIRIWIWIDNSLNLEETINK